MSYKHNDPDTGYVAPEPVAFPLSPAGQERPSPRRGRPAQTPVPERELPRGRQAAAGQVFGRPQCGPGGTTAAHGLGLPAASAAAPPTPARPEG